MAITHVGTTDLQLQPDWTYNDGQNPSASLSYKGSLTACETYLDTLTVGDELAEPLIPSLPAGLVIVGWRLARVAGDNAVITLQAEASTRVELTWQTVLKPIFQHPYLTGAPNNFDSTDFAAVTAALAKRNVSEDAFTAARTALDADQIVLLDFMAGGLESYQVDYPHITLEQIFTDLPKEVQGGNVEEAVDALVDDYIEVPTSDGFGNVYTYVRHADVVTVDQGGVGRIKKSWTGFPNIVSWLYAPYTP